MQLNYDQIDLAPTYPDAKILLLGPRFDITLNKKLFWSTFIQYSNQRENLSVNSRLQWRFAPLSDLFWYIMTIIIQRPLLFLRCVPLI